MITVRIVTPRSDSRWAALTLIVVAQFMVILDVAIVNVALPDIKSDLGFTQAGLEWVITAYAIVFGGFLLLGGRLADVLGRRRIFIAGIAIFAISSMLCGLSWSAGSLIGFRAVEGLGGALLAPAGLALLMTTFPEGRERNVALGIWGAASGSGAAVGVLLGGVLTSYLSWPWIFFINVPVGLALLVAVPRFLAATPPSESRRHFDVAGATSATASLMLLVYGLTNAPRHGWGDPLTAVPLVAAVVLGVAFVLIERHTRVPLLPLRLFRIRTLAVANVLFVIIASVAFSEFFLLTLYLQDVLGYSAAQTGLAFSAIALTIAVVSNVAQTFVTRFGPRRVLTAGLLLVTGSLALLTRLPIDGHYGVDLLPAFMLNGIGLAFCFVPVTIAGLAGVPRPDAGIASGLVNASRQVGGAVGLAVVNTIAASYAVSGSHASVEAAQLRGYHVAFVVLAVLTLAGVALAALFLGPPAAQQPESEAFVPAETPLKEAA